VSFVIPRIPRNAIRFEVTRGAEVPDRTFTWLDEATGNPIPFVAQPHTFELLIATTPVTSKTTGIFGSDGDPNVLITFAQGEVDAIAIGHYHAQLWAKRTSDGKDREPIDFRFVVENKIGLVGP
jgi:hypothetical protein